MIACVCVYIYIIAHSNYLIILTIMVIIINNRRIIRCREIGENYLTILLEE